RTVTLTLTVRAGLRSHVNPPDQPQHPLTSRSWGKWSKSKYHCGLFGSPGLRIKYSWVTEKGSPCIKVKYFVKGGPKGHKTRWTKPLCRKSGTLNVPWGNVAGTKEIQIKGASLVKWR
ncbi:hypothetical protein, partial [Streptomyces ipomoeae]